MMFFWENQGGAASSCPADQARRPANLGGRLEARPSLVLLLLALPLFAQEAELSFYDRLSEAAWNRLAADVRYDPAYVSIPYPGGDVPADTGVCTDVVIRSYRALGLDLQKLVHEDMRGNFARYPKRWGLSGPDKNIDHRRVPNLQTFFTRRGASLPVTDKAEDYLPGDVVAWNLRGDSGELLHIGVVVRAPRDETGGGWIVHNIGGGPQLEQALFDWKIIGHYRFGDGVASNYAPE